MLKTAQRKHRIENSSRGEWQQVGDRMGEGKKRIVFQSYTPLFQCLPWGKGPRSEEGQPHSAESSMLESDRESMYAISTPEFLLESRQQGGKLHRGQRETNSL